MSDIYGKDNSNRSGSEYSGREKIIFLLCSVFIILTGIFYYFLDLIRKAVGFFKAGTDSFYAVMNSDPVGTVTGISGVLKNGYKILNHSAGMLTVIHVAAGISGIVFIAVYSSKKYRDKLGKAKFIPVLCGILSIAVSTVNTVILAFSHTYLLLYFLMLAVMFITPVFFTKSALGFYRNSMR